MLQRSHPVPSRHIWQKKHLLFITSPVKSPSCKKIQIQYPFIALILFLLSTLTLEQALNKEISAWHRNKWAKCVQPFQESCQGYPALGCEGIEVEGIGGEKKHKIVEVNYKMHQGFCFLIPAGSSMLGKGHRSREVAEWQTAPTWGCHKILSLTLSQGTIQLSSAKEDNFSGKQIHPPSLPLWDLFIKALEEPILRATSGSCRNKTKAL